MRKLKTIILFGVIMLPLVTLSQEPKFVYCQIIASEKFLSNKVTVELDFGQKLKFFADNRLKDEKGKPISFNSNIDAMNFMGKYGWELSHVTMTTVPTGMGTNTLVYYNIMKKLFVDLDEEAKTEYLKK